MPSFDQEIFIFIKNIIIFARENILTIKKEKSTNNQI